MTGSVETPGVEPEGYGVPGMTVEFGVDVGVEVLAPAFCGMKLSMVINSSSFIGIPM